MFEKIRVFLGEVRSEIKKVTWPRPQELKESTTVVIISVFIITVFISIMDLILNRVLDFILRLGA
ncbi:MAG: preprotein translocase subunit SecE [Candidatus Eisenbacteria bacterium]|uniref:Protein translocase subunit SecE n=1 Tax=Eiseniibacteriota bacterium TaxID=2212470 RepID=A0A937XCF7_UNCEI|nr:preprotein translocase subunit SecE [Candidatus Eisenbacteria bacterium]